jgi:F-type H+-transporting ATPase subunit delta
MTNRTAATRYARALLDVIVKEHAAQDKVRLAEYMDKPARLRQIESQLAEFVDLFKQYPALEKVMLNPAVPVPRKRAAMDELIKRAALTPVLANLIALLTDRDRLVLLPDLLAAYRERMLDHLQVVRAEVTTAVALTRDRASAVEESLARVTGRAVTLVTRVDPSIIGGVVARIGSTVYDGSVTRQLQRMKEKLDAV